MKTLLLTAVLAGSVVYGAPSASACHLGPGDPHPGNLDCWDHSSRYDWRGVGCSFETLNDTTPGGQLGGQNVWNGAIVVAVRAVHDDAGPDPDGDGPLVGIPPTPAPTVSISVDCGLSINGGTPTTVLTASGTGFAQNADQIQFTAASGSVIVLCSNITVGGDVYTDCGTAEESPICPDPICGPGGVLEVVLDAIVAATDPVFDLLAELTAGTDPVVCSVLIPVARTINSIDPDLLYVDDGTDVGHDCDIYFDNTRAIDLVPYNDAPTRTPPA